MKYANAQQPHTLPSRTSRHANQNLAKSVSVLPHGRKRNNEGTTSPIRKQGFRAS